eukprot:scaffold11500_cov117-Isochrysis_galbana.AAC.4
MRICAVRRRRVPRAGAVRWCRGGVVRTAPLATITYTAATGGGKGFQTTCTTLEEQMESFF